MEDRSEGRGFERGWGSEVDSRGVGEKWVLRVAREDRREVEGRRWREYVYRKGEGGGRVELRVFG